ncbi:polynucleotide phosphorylase [Peptococcaceae bacterium SCADC1_2_3]|jgi:polyribonucleotide nucleotidyltransferase|nr:polynucleotide phosphorylase [Peptococcaceae bacterium SCADC1_2_3]
MLTQPVLKKKLEIGGRTLQIETGRVARQSGGAVLVSYGDTVVLVTATMSKKPREGIDFFPLTVDYEERLYAVGKIPGGFIKREGRPSEKAVLSGRLIDRSIRPLFPENFRREVQIIVTVLSIDRDNVPEVASLIGASTALQISEIPFQGPVGGVIVGLVDDQYVVNPTLKQTNKSKMHLMVVGTTQAVMMVEAGAQEVPEADVLGGIAYGNEVIKEICTFITSFREEALTLGLAKPKIELEKPDLKTEIEAAVINELTDTITKAVEHCQTEKLGKMERENYLEKTKAELLPSFLSRFPEEEVFLSNLIEKIKKKVIRRFILKEGKRIDGRSLKEVRPLYMEVGVLPRTHGSALFTRGQTQVLSVVTLGAVSDEQILDGLGIEESKRFMHHYNFPPYSTGETRPMRTTSRREIGHGALVERALESLIPNEETFPYTIRLVSEALESNGSTSMGSVCSSCLALMDAGVSIKAPVAGIAMGLIKEDDKLAILTDIQGIEDHLGDMDFKVAGTMQGITALQMDIKIAGVNREILEKALVQALEARLFILAKVQEVIAAPRPELSPYAPRIFHMIIDPEKIRDVIGPGGKIIKKIIEETGVEIDIEDDGRVFITATDPVAGEKAQEIIKNLTKEITAGEIYNGQVTRVTDFGCFVEIIPGMLGLPGKEGLVHISQLAHQRVNKVEDVVKEGDRVMVKVIGYDDHGRLKLSRKDALPVLADKTGPRNKRSPHKSMR